MEVTEYVKNVMDLIKDADSFIKYLQESNDSISEKKSMYLDFLNAECCFYREISSEVCQKISQFKENEK